MKVAQLVRCLIICAGAVVFAAAVSAQSPPASNLELARQLNQAFVQVAEQVSPSVVIIKVVQKAPVRNASHGKSTDDEGGDPLEGVPPELREFFRHGARGPVVPELGQGSGIIIRDDGYILTNAHVVEDAGKITVSLLDGRTFDAQVRGVDAPSDIAVIKINAQGLHAAKLADSSKTRVGEFAIAIGAPFALEYSVTFGHVSAKDRAGILSPADGGGMMDQAFIQTDANINPGNSGGPLVNIDGEVIGINSLIRGLHTGIGFAVPINLAREVADQIIDQGKFTRAWLGVGVKSLRETPELRDLLPGVKDGVVVDLILPDGPAAKSKLAPTDVITAVDGKPVATVQQLKDEIRGKKIGGEVLLDVYRQADGKEGTQMKIIANPVEWTDPNATAETPAGGPVETTSALSATDWGVKVKALTRDLANQLGVKTTEGVVVGTVERSGLVAQTGIRPGEIITSINHKHVSNPKEFKELLKKANTKKGVIVNVIGEEGMRFEVVKEGRN